ncbi:MAG: Calx-beta domain-containing protein, partial [Bacteroidia bacterium]
GIGVADGGFIYIKWTTNDRFGQGNRDEIGLDNISVAMQTGVVTANVALDSLTYNINEAGTSITIGLTQSIAVNCSVDVMTTDITAVNGFDYNGGLQTVSFDGINVTSSVTIPIVNDAIIEALESFEVMLTNASTGCLLVNPSIANVNIIDDDTPVPADVNFTIPTAVVNEPAGTIDVTIDQTVLRNCTMDVNVVAGTANAGDYTLISPVVINFDSTSTTKLLSIPIIDDALFELPEYFKIQISNVVGNCNLVPSDTMRITIISNDAPPMRDIGPLTTVNATGTPDSLNVYCKVKGVAYGTNTNISANGYQFGLADATGSIWVIRTNVALNYTLTEGDSLEIYGLVLLQSGMTRFRPDSIMLINQGNPLPATINVTALTETNEADIARLNMVKLINPAQWTGTGGGFNLAVTNYVDTFLVRVDNDVDAFSMPAPTCSWLNITGLVGQFDNATPFLTGYQLLPRYMTDFECLPEPEINFNVASGSVAEISGNISFDAVVTNPNLDTTMATITLSGTATNGTDYVLSPVNISFPAGTSTVTIPVNVLDDAIFEGPETVIATITAPVNGVVGTLGVYTLTIDDAEDVGITSALPVNAISLYPNPTTNSFVINTNEKVNQVRMYDALGKCVLNQTTGDNIVATKSLTNGIYNVVISTDKGIWSGKLVKE